MKRTFFILFILTPVFLQAQNAYTDYNDLIKEAEKLFSEKKYGKSAKTYSKAFNNDKRGTSNDRYNAASAWAMAGKPDSAFHYLFIISKRSNFQALDYLLKDSNLVSLHADKRWSEVVTVVEKNRGFQGPKINTEAQKVLGPIYYYDQHYRRQLDSLRKQFGHNSKEVKDHWKIINYYDSINQIKVCQIIDKYGWLSVSEVGQNENEVLFLVIQHSNLKTQEKYLPIMRQAVKDGKARASSLALLEDRILMRNGKKQLYGSQIQTNDKGEYSIYPIEDESHVNRRRSEMGLGPLEDYLKIWGLIFNVPQE